MTCIETNDRVVLAREFDRDRSARGLWAAVLSSVSRNEFFSALFILALLNGLAARAVDDYLMVPGIPLLGVSAIVWFACYAAISLVCRSTEKDEVTNPDLLVSIAILLLVVVPIKESSWLALAAQAIYVLGVSRAGSAMRRGALIFFALTIPMCGGPLVLRAFAQPFLWTDAVFVANLIGTERIGNVVKFADGAATFQIFPPCSSFHNMSLAFLAWMAISQYLKHKWSPKDIAWCLLAGFSVFGVNAARLALIGLYREHYETLHGSIGSTVADLLSLSLIIGICLLGVRREIFARV
jgi:hypothetical protein